MKHKKSSNPKHGKSGKRTTSGALGEISVLIISEITDEGDVLAVPFEWTSRKVPPHIYLIDAVSGPAVGKGDRVLARLRKIKAHLYQAQVIRILPQETPKDVLGVFVATKGGGGIIEPVSRKNKDAYMVAEVNTGGAQHGELVSGQSLPELPGLGLPQARIDNRLGDLKSPKAASLIAAHMHNLPSVFSRAALVEAENAAAPILEAGREDIRHIPLVTIDGEDARDFDDAVFAEPDPEHEGGFHLLVAIADVAYYVSEGSALDKDAFERGNSVYFPDRVIPMLPERLSNGLCSLKPDEDRYCVAVHLWIDAKGVMRRYRFIRALMRSQARLTYTKVEESRHKNDNPLISNLFAAYNLLAHERDARGALALHLPEYKVEFDAHGNVVDIRPRETLESHRLIEAFMVAANVAAADYLLKSKAPGIYRVHEMPSDEKLDDLRKFLGLSGYSLPKGNITPAHLNKVLRKADNEPNAAVIHTAVLRSQMQAYYAAENLGHFGLGLQKYAHFTSPIRRYADLIVHRSLAALLAQDKHMLPARGHLPETALHISETERKAMLAERDAMDRYKVSFMARHAERNFTGSITSLNEFGLFVSLEGNGITGFVPVRNLGHDFFQYSARHSNFRGQRTQRIYALGDAIVVSVEEANPITGSLIFRPEAEETLQPLRAKKLQKDKEKRNAKTQRVKTKNKYSRT